MKQENPKFEFLNTNPNPSLEEILAQSRNKNEKPKEVIQNLKDSISLLKIQKSIYNLIEKLEKEISNEELFEATCTLKAIKTFPLLRKNRQLQKNFLDIQQSIDDSYNSEPHEKALFLLCELIFLNKSIYEPLEDVKNELSPEAFTLYIAFQTIGCVNGDGWACGIFGNMPQLVPYIPKALEVIGYKKVPQAIRNTTSVFPVNTSFLFDNKEYINVLNFIENPRRKVDNQKLKKYTKQEREQFCTNYQKSLQQLEEVEDEIWNGDNEWLEIYEYYNDNLEKKIWKTTHNTVYK